MPTISEALATAQQLHRSGRLREAEAIYRQILQVDPGHAVATHLLGLVAVTCGSVEPGIALYRRSIALNPGSAAVHSDLGAALKGQGKVDEAIAAYRQALALDPHGVQALHNLSDALCEAEEFEEALACASRAVALRPDISELHASLGNVYQKQKRHDQAITCYERALTLKPGNASVHNNLGVLWYVQGRLQEAIACFRRAIAVTPGYIEAYSNLGKTWDAQGERDTALACYRKALELNPGSQVLKSQLESALRHAARRNSGGTFLADLSPVLSTSSVVQSKPLGRMEEAIVLFNRALTLGLDAPDAIELYRAALKIRPDFAEAVNNLGLSLSAQEQPDEAISCFRRAIELRPEFAQAYNNLGVALTAKVKSDNVPLDDPLEYHRRALELKPDSALLASNLGNCLKQQGRLDEAIACYRRAVELDLGSARIHSNLLLLLLLRQQETAETLLAEHELWNQRHAVPLLTRVKPHCNDRSAGRRLRIGYVSPHFNFHPVGLFMEPLLAAHDQAQFEIYCYASVLKPDKQTELCRAHANTWRNIVALSDEAVSEQIRQDQIDILVDLSMHTDNHRLLVFAHRPAPVQVTYLAYCGTTGLSAMDYRLSDPFIDPPGEQPGCYSEETVWLPETFWCYKPHSPATQFEVLTVREPGPIRFGSMNAYCKVSPEAFDTWCEILRRVPNSTLLLHADAGSHRTTAYAKAQERGIGPERLKFVGPQTFANYFATYHGIDITLDPFPYAGGTTTCDALWMGVPVVSLAGHTAVGRGGLSILNNIGLPELVAHNTKEYVDTATRLAGDHARLSELRQTLRTRMQSSPLMDANRFARNVEAAYCGMWQRWCKEI